MSSGDNTRFDLRGFIGEVAPFMAVLYRTYNANPFCGYAIDKRDRKDRFVLFWTAPSQLDGYSAFPVKLSAKEVGGVMVTLAALCGPNGIDMMAAAQTELDRINQPDTILKIRQKQAAKPVGSALPLPAAPEGGG